MILFKNLRIFRSVPISDIRGENLSRSIVFQKQLRNYGIVCATLAERRFFSIFGPLKGLRDFTEAV